MPDEAPLAAVVAGMDPTALELLGRMVLYHQSAAFRAAVEAEKERQLDEWWLANLSAESRAAVLATREFDQTMVRLLSDVGVTLDEAASIREGLMAMAPEESRG